MHNKNHPDTAVDKNESLKSNSRRNLLLGIGAIIGTASAYKLLKADAVSIALDYTPNTNQAAQVTKLLSKQSILVLREICAQVIPNTDTLGAAEVDVHGFIDNQLFACHSEDEQELIIELLAKVDAVSLEKHKSNFIDINASSKLEILNALEQGNNNFKQQDRHAFKFLKSLIVFGYYTSEVGVSQELTYLAIPGGYQNSIPVDSVRTSFAPTDFY